MEDDKLPKRSYDLIDWLDEEVPAPAFPRTLVGCKGLTEEEIRQRIFLAGQRHMVDVLLFFRDEERRTEEGVSSVVNETPLRFARPVPEDGDLHYRSVPAAEGVDSSSVD